MTVIGTLLYEDAYIKLSAKKKKDAYITQPWGKKKLKATNKHIRRQTFEI